MSVTEEKSPLVIRGIRLSAVAAGLRYTGRDDLALIELAPGTNTVGVFTRNRFCAAPVAVARDHLSKKTPRWLLFNAGNANAGTGQGGIDAAQETCGELARLVGGQGDEVLPFSTGVIGERLDPAKMISMFPSLHERLSCDNWRPAAAAILTTDTVTKIASAIYAPDNDTTYTVTGIAKGSGMIHPNMATMLAFIATDAGIEPGSLQTLLGDAVDNSFNRITVDGDTSTNDSCVLSATNQVEGTDLLSPGHAHWDGIKQAITLVAKRLAQAIVRDGEGATRFVEITVTGRPMAENIAVANTVALSPLVKTALFAGDPNWGRILAAVGRAPIESFDVNDVNIFLGDYQIVVSGELNREYDEATAARIMAEKDIAIRINIGSGNEHATVWTCDLSYDYVKINAEYRS